MINIPGFAPHRRVIRTDGEGVLIGIQPPKELGYPEAQVWLTTNQYARYVGWLAGHGLIQEVFPELTADLRELLQSGLTDKNLRDIGEAWEDDE